MSFTHTHDFIISAPADRVFRALVEPSELKQWFAEEAQIEPKVGGVYRFWGRHTLGTPAHDAARQTITHFEPPVTLGYSWPIHDVDTDVTLALAPGDAGTKLSLAHHVTGDLKVSRAKELIDDHWRRAIGNLSSHLAGESVMLPDYFDRRFSR